MESKLNTQAVDNYSRAFSEKITRAFFENHERAGGPELLELSPVNQVNLMIIMNLFQAWRKEFSKLRSPYFDYNHKEVRKGLKEFMNVLSRHISIEEGTLAPLVAEATQKTLQLILSPYDFFSQLINGSGRSRLTRNELKDWKKYVKINQHLLQGLIDRFEEEDKKEVFADEAFRLFNEVLETLAEPPEDFDDYVAAFSEVVPLSVDELFGVKPKLVAKDEESAPKTLNDRLAAEPKATLADIHAKQNAGSIRKGLTLNQRVMFVKQLFKGEEEQFTRAIDAVESADNLDHALQYLVDQHASHYSWDMDSEEVSEFLEVISKRFT